MIPIALAAATWRKVFSCLGVTALLLVTQAPASGRQLAFVEQGKSDYVIVVAPDALETPKFAARELQTYVERVSGARLPIAGRLPAGKKPVFVGPSEFTKALGLSAEELGPEGFRIRTVGDALAIIGRDTPGNPLDLHWKSAPQTGTYYGVCAFLEKYLGIRWFMPTELGEVVPRAESISLSDIDLREAPPFVNRSIWFSAYDQGGKEGVRWLRRNRVGHSLIVSCSHNWWSIIPCDPSPRGWPSYIEPRQPYRDHPEYYALVNGRRRMSHYGDRMGGQVCTTNPDVIRIFAETAVDYFRKHPDTPMFSISWNDGGTFCECDRCRALDSGTDAKGRPILADRLTTFYNAVGRLVYQQCPDKLLGAYVFYGGDLPQRATVFKNIFLSSPYNEISTLFFNAEYRRRAYDQIRAWGKLCDNMSFYSAYHGSGFWSFPYSSTPLLADLFPVLKAAGNKCITFYGVEGWGGNGLDLYLGILCQDPDPLHLLAAETAPSGKVWDDNEIEVFFDPRRDGKLIYQFLLNHLGAACGLKIENSRAGRSGSAAWTAKTSLQAGGWSAEIAIPWAALGADVPVPGDLWRFNVCRVRRSSRDPAVEYSAYSPTFGLFNRPDRFADVVFK